MKSVTTRVTTYLVTLKPLTLQMKNAIFQIYIRIERDYISMYVSFFKKGFFPFLFRAFTREIRLVTLLVTLFLEASQHDPS